MSDKHDLLADDILSRLRGYMYRQTFHAQDRALLGAILRDCDREVGDLESRLVAAETEVTRLRAYHADYARKLVGPRG